MCDRSDRNLIVVVTIGRFAQRPEPWAGSEVRALRHIINIIIIIFNSDSFEQAWFEILTYVVEHVDE